MGIRGFISILFCIAFVMLFYTDDTKLDLIKKRELPTVVFDDSTMYKIDSNSVLEILQSSKVNIFKNKEEFVDATIVLKPDDENNETNNISAKYILKIDDTLYLNGDVNLYMANDLSLATQELTFNMKKKIGSNSSAFIAKKDNNILYGNNLYLDVDNKHIVANNTKFQIDVRDK